MALCVVAHHMIELVADYESIRVVVARVALQRVSGLIGIRMQQGARHYVFIVGERWRALMCPYVIRCPLFVGVRFWSVSSQDQPLGQLHRDPQRGASGETPTPHRDATLGGRGVAHVLRFDAHASDLCMHCGCWRTDDLLRRHYLDW